MGVRLHPPADPPNPRTREPPPTPEPPNLRQSTPHTSTLIDDSDDYDDALASRARARVKSTGPGRGAGGSDGGGGDGGEVVTAVTVNGGDSDEHEDDVSEADYIGMLGRRATDAAELEVENYRRSVNLSELLGGCSTPPPPPMPPPAQHSHSRTSPPPPSSIARSHTVPDEGAHSPCRSIVPPRTALPHPCRRRRRM